jgi:hypothetical protein
MVHGAQTAQECFERQRDELVVLQSMYPDHFVEEEMKDGIAFLVLTDTAVLSVSLPVCYPFEEPQLALSCPGGSATAVAAALKELELMTQHSKEAEMECCAELIAHFLELVEVKLAPPEAATEHITEAEVTPTVDVEVPGSNGDGPVIPQQIKALVTNVHNSKCKVYIGRPDANPKGRGGKPASGHPRWGWGNPFSMGGGASRGSVIRQYTNWIMAPERSNLRAEARRELRGKTLGCFCTPLSCHGHMLALIANTDSDEELSRCLAKGTAND